MLRQSDLPKVTYWIYGKGKTRISDLQFNWLVHELERSHLYGIGQKFLTYFVLKVAFFDCEN